MKNFTTSLGEQVELSPYEASILETVRDYHARIVVLASLKTYCNAEKVWCVMELQGQKRGTSYTICPIIEQIGDRTPEQYIADVEKVAREFAAKRREYVQKFTDAKTAKERSAVVAWFDEYLRSMEAK